MRTARRSSHASRQVILGLLVIGMGMLFLADNLGWWDVRQTLQFWPVVFIAVGVLKLVDSRGGNGFLVGGAMIAVGAVMILNRMGVIHVSWRMAWPLLLIALGAAVLLRAFTGRRLLGRDKDISQADDTVDVVAVLGGFERRITTPAFQGGEVTAVMGGCALDMRQCGLTGEAVINVFAFWGGVTIKVPPDWTVILHGTPIMGGFEEKTATPPDDSKRLIVRGYAIMGGVEVKN
jgi:predicted membrane protein